MPPGPISFVPLLKERPWGGRALEGRWGKPLPADASIGESWELSDREDDQSVVVAGPHAGRELNELWRAERALFGTRAEGAGDRFPLLVKVLDARETLSVQVHPPAQVAASLGGHSKTEVWYVAAAEAGAHLFAGLRPGVTQASFAAALEAGDDVSVLLHRVEVGVGDVLTIPSGRIHALGAGTLVFEVQENSDTTYRVYDFDRRGVDGELRELHVPQSLACIDFDDVEPALHPTGDGVLADNEHFTVTRRALDGPEVLTTPGECAVICVVDGEAVCAGERFGPGATVLLPAGPDLPVAGPAVVLVVELPSA